MKAMVMKAMVMKAMATKGRLITGAMALSSAAALAAETIERSAITSDSPSISIEIDSGYLTIEAWDRSEVRIEGELDDTVEDWSFEGDEDAIDIVVEEARSRWGGDWERSGRSETRLTLYVPAQAAVSFEGVNTSLRATGLAGRIEAETVNGSMTVSDLQASAALSSVNGSISAERVAGNLELETVNGDVNVVDASGEQLALSAVNGDLDVQSTATDVDIDAVSGDVDLQLADVRRIKISLVSGDLDARLHLMDGGRLTADAVSGDLNLTLVEPINIRVTADSMSGDLDNAVTAVKSERGNYVGNSLAFTTGDASARVEVNTVSGDLSLRRAKD